MLLSQSKQSDGREGRFGVRGRDVSTIHGFENPGSGFKKLDGIEKPSS